MGKSSFLQDFCVACFAAVYDRVTHSFSFVNVFLLSIS